MLACHPSVGFYRGEVHVVVWRPRDSQPFAPATSSTQSSVHEAREGWFSFPDQTIPSRSVGVFELHQMLLPPSKVDGLGEASNEQYAQSLASEDGLELLRCNWELFLVLLFPCLREGDPVSAPVPVTSSPGVQTTEAERVCTASQNDSCLDGEAPDGAATSPSVSPPLLRSSESLALPLVTSPEVCRTCHISDLDLTRLCEPGIVDRIYYSYIVFLRFFGWKVHDEKRGLLDRHRGWKQRYDLLSPFEARRPACEGSVAHASAKDEDLNHNTVCDSDRVGKVPYGCSEPPDVRSGPNITAALCSTAAESPNRVLEYGRFDFYADAIPRILQSLLGLGFVILPVRLVEFLIEEMAAGRLGFLYDLVEKKALPMVESCKAVDASHIKRLRKRFQKLTESNSD